MKAGWNLINAIKLLKEMGELKFTDPEAREDDDSDSDGDDDDDDDDDEEVHGHPDVDRRVAPCRKRHDARRASCRRAFTSSGAARREHPHAGRVGTTSPLSASLGGEA